MAFSMVPYRHVDSNPVRSNTQPPVVRYRECLRNHAAPIGGYANDGCGEYTDGLLLKCAACGCHRNFHRKEFPVGEMTDRRLTYGGLVSWNPQTSVGLHRVTPSPRQTFIPGFGVGHPLPEVLLEGTARKTAVEEQAQRVKDWMQNNKSTVGKHEPDSPAT